MRSCGLSSTLRAMPGLHQLFGNERRARPLDDGCRLYLELILAECG
jgi:hypothetical protein